METKEFRGRNQDTFQEGGRGGGERTHLYVLEEELEK